MDYYFKALVIDDEVQMKDTLDIYKQYLSTKHNVNVDFELINNESQFNIKKPYDLLLVDYDLKKGFSKTTQLGDEFIHEFRKINKVSRIIFYSSSFIYNQRNKYELPLATKEIFNLINNLKINKIADKNNFDLMIDVIKDCCDDMDILPLMLSKFVSEYKKMDITMSYTNSKGEDMEVQDLISDLLNDSLEGRHFRKQLTETMINTLLKFRY